MALTIEQLKGATVGACVSGGLDSRTIAKCLTEAGVKVIGFTADLGQPDEKNINDIRDRMAPCGVETVIVDLRQPMAEACFEVIEAQAMYDGGYWNSTGIARAVTVRGLLPKLRKHGCTVLVHGATGRGNDQMRFERYTNVLDPEMRVYAPWRDATLLKRFPGRTQMAEYLAGFGIPAPVGTKKKYSTDANLAGLSHEAEDLESLETAMTIVVPTMGVWPMQAPEKPERFTVRFEAARPVALNGRELDPVAAMIEANAIGGRNGVGILDMVENRLVGMKSRGVYETPGGSILYKAHDMLEQLCLDKNTLHMKQRLALEFADLVYNGLWFTPLREALSAFVDKTQEAVTGTVKLKLYKGNIVGAGMESPNSLYDEGIATFGEDEGAYDQKDSAGFIALYGLPIAVQAMKKLKK